MKKKNLARVTVFPLLFSFFNPREKQSFFFALPIIPVKLVFIKFSPIFHLEYVN